MLLYIDPGTGSMLFTILIGIIGTAIYTLRMLFIRIKFKFSGGKSEIGLKKIPYVIFSDDKRYWNVFEPICREFDKRGIDIVYMTASEDDPALNSELPHLKAEFIGKDNKAFSKLNFLNARVVLSTTPGLDVYQWKRSKEVDFYAHILHAPCEVVLYRMYGLDYYDAIFVSGDYQINDIRQLEKLRNLPEKELVRVGIPYMDEMKKRFEKEGNTEEHQRTVLLAPSWGPSSIFNIYGEKILEKLLETGYHIIVRPHPQSFKSETELMDKLMSKYPESDQLEWNRDNDNFNVLNRSDILVSDFSGVIFDFSLIYGKPVIYTDPNFDVGVYDAWWLETPLWTTTALPRIGQQLHSENLENIKELIDSCIEDAHYAEGIAAVKAETWINESEGAVKAVDYLVNKYNELTEMEDKQK